MSTARRTRRTFTPIGGYSRIDRGEQIPPQISYESYLAGGHVEVVSFGAARRILLAYGKLATDMGIAYSPHWARPEYSTAHAKVQLHNQEIRHHNYIESLLHALYSRIHALETELEAHRDK